MSDTLASVDVLILCGGRGTRLRSVVADRPKPLATVADRPFLDLLIHRLYRAGARRFILCSGYRGDQIAAHAGACDLPVEIEVSQEPSPLGTGGAVKLAESRIRADQILVTNGDSHCGVDLPACYGFHRSREALLTLVLGRSASPEDCGTVEVAAGGRILRFREKQPGGGDRPISAGIYLLRREALAFLPATGPCSLEVDLFPRLVAENRACYGFDSRRPVLDIGTPERLARARRELAALEVVDQS